MPTDKQRRSAERRRLQRQAERRQQQAARHRRINLIVSVVGALAIIGVVIGVIVATTGSDTTKKASTTSPASTAASTAASSTVPASSTAPATEPASSRSSTRVSTAAAPPASPAAKTVSCSYPTSGTAARAVTKPPARASAGGTVAVRLATSQGPMTFTLNRAAAPCTVNSFVSLARQKYFTGTSCHRLVTKGIFVLQCGDPTGKGTGGPGYRFADELTGKEVYSRGVLAMANAGPDTNGSQFFIVDKNTSLGPSYTIFGTVSAGLGVADKVSAAGTSDGSTDGPPKLKLTFTSVTVG